MQGLCLSIEILWKPTLVGKEDEVKANQQFDQQPRIEARVDPVVAHFWVIHLWSWLQVGQFSR